MTQINVMDFNGWSLRRMTDEGMQTLYGCTGTPPVSPRQTFDWSWPPSSRKSLPTEVPLLGSAWADWTREKGEWFFKVNHGEGIETQISARDALSSFLAARINEFPGHKTILAVPNRLSESRQEELLKTLLLKNCPKIELIWRPVALALWALKHKQTELENCKRVIVVDADGPECEITLLHLISHKGAIVPERGIYKRSDRGNSVFNCQTILSKMLPGDVALDSVSLSAVVEQLERNRPTVKIPYVSAAQWKISSRRNGESFLNERLNQFINRTEKILKTILLFSGDAAIIYHGWPFQYIEPPKGLDGQLACIRSESDAIVKGAQLHLKGRTNKKITYFDTIPGLYLPTIDKKTSLPRMDALIPRQRVAGGTILQKTFPKRYNFSAEKPEISIFLFRGGDEKWRKMTCRLDGPSAQKVTVKISSEMASGQGTTKVFIEEVSSEKSITSNFSVVIDWNDMKDDEPKFFGSPSYWPTPGRIFDKDKQGLIAAETWLSLDNPALNSLVPFYGVRTQFEKVLNKSKQSPKDPSRGLLGSDYRDSDEKMLSLIEKLASEIYSQCARTPARAKYLNYLYVYAPYEHREYIRSIFRDKNTVQVSSWNHAYAPGYQFSSPDDFDLLLGWIENQSQNQFGGFPGRPETTYTQKYFWSCFRCLCYFPDTVLVGSEKIRTLLHSVLMYIRSINFPQRQDEKFILCLILFSLRIREIEPDFLNPGDVLYEELVSLMSPNRDLYGVSFPPGMLQQAHNNDNLTNFVLRFLRREPTSDDLQALEGLSLSV